MTLNNVATQENIINEKENILHKHLSTTNHQQMTLHALKIDTWMSQVLIHGSSVISIKEKMSRWITLCQEYFHDYQIIYLQMNTKKHTLPKDTLDQVELN